jgi:hypothetical protein
MTANALSKKACSKPSCISISSAAKPMPPAERSSRDLLETRLRQARGTEPGRANPASPEGGCRSGAEVADKTQPAQKTSAGAARRRPPTERSAEIKAMASAAAKTAMRRISLIVTGSSVFWRITE